MSDILDECCSCRLNPPCNYCLETYACECCGTRVEAAEELQRAAEALKCNECFMRAE